MLQHVIRSLLAAGMFTAWVNGPLLGLELPKGLVAVTERVPAPSTMFLDENGGIKNLQSFRGKIIVLNFWATWCSPCVKEIPSLQRLSDRLPKGTFAVVAVSQDKGGVAVAEAFLEKVGATGFPLYADPKGQLYRDIGIRGLPTTIVINKTGLVEARLEGPAEWDREDFVSYLLGLSDNISRALE